MPSKAKQLKRRIARRLSRDVDMARLMAADDRAQADASRAVGLIVGVTVAGIVAAFLIPVAIDEIVAVDTANWSDGASSLWDILDLILVLAVFLFLIGLALLRSQGV